MWEKVGGTPREARCITNAPKDISHMTSGSCELEIHLPSHLPGEAWWAGGGFKGLGKQGQNASFFK